MNKSDEEPKLLNEFSTPTYDEWLSLVEEQLKGVPFEKKLVHQSYEGIPIQPIYLRSDVADLSERLVPPGQYPYIRGTRASGKTETGWAISEPLRFPTVDALNQAARHDLERGLTCLELVLDRAGKSGVDPDNARSGDVGRDGLSLLGLAEMEAVFDGIDPGSVRLQLEGGSSGLSLLLLLLAYCRKAGFDPKFLQGSLLFDPLADAAREGDLSFPITELYEEMSYLIRLQQKEAPGMRTIGIDARPFAEGGGSAVQELGYAMATAVSYLREMQNRGFGIDESAAAFSFNFATGSDFFLEIAKLRAARALWARIVSMLGGGELSCKAVVLSSSARYNKTIYDPYVNMLRATTEAFSAVLGGADVVSVSPFDDLFGLPDEMSRRVARNLQLILREECHGSDVIDPAGGTWFVEKLTDQLCEAAWKVLQDIEKKGGMLAALMSGEVQEAIAGVDRERRKKLGQRKDVAVGTNIYANLGETLPETRLPDYENLWQQRAAEAAKVRGAVDLAPDLLDLAASRGDAEGMFVLGIKAAEKGATLGELNVAIFGETRESERIAPIEMRRKTVEYEALRRKSAELAAKTGQAPRVFLANMGPLRQHKARADFSTGFFQPGGFDVIYPDGFERVEGAVTATVESGATIAVICSTDETYPDLVPEYARVLKERRPDVTVIVAGYPKEHVPAFQEAGVDAFIHIKADNLEILSSLQAKLDRQ